jgi:hypothetical protein
MDYYLLEQDLRLEGIGAVGALPEDIEPLDWMRGKRMPPPQQVPLRLQLSTNSGSAHTDIMGSLVTLFSDALKLAMSEFAVSNIDFFPVELEHPLTHVVRQGWWLANIVGIAECVDPTRSSMRTRRSGRGLILKTFYIDEARAPKAPLFRLGEKPTLVIVNADLRAHLKQKNLAGVRMRHTRVYDGF